MDPGPGLGGDHCAPVEMRGRGRPPGLGDLPPAPPFTLEQIREPVATDRGGRRSVTLDPEGHVPPGRPALTHRYEVLLIQLSKRVVIVGAKPCRARLIDREPIQHRKQVVAAAPGKLRRQRRRPVGAVRLETVTEDQADQAGWHSLKHWVADCSQVRLGRGRGVVVQHRTFGSDRGALDVLPRESGVRQQHNPGTRPGLDHDPIIVDGQPLVGTRRLLQRAGTDVRGDQFIAWPG
jgi:hypothetical protein